MTIKIMEKVNEMKVQKNDIKVSDASIEEIIDVIIENANLSKQRNESFIDYCLEWYGKETPESNWKTDINATRSEIKKALETRLNDKVGILREFSKPLSEIPFGSGSIDREMIRDILLIQRGEQPWETIFSPMPFSERFKGNRNNGKGE